MDTAVASIAGYALARVPPVFIVACLLLTVFTILVLLRCKADEAKVGPGRVDVEVTGRTGTGSRTDPNDGKSTRSLLDRLRGR